MSDSLTLLGLKYNTNKSFYHGYTRFYNKLFAEKKDSIKHFFEIGIATGASLFMWRDYFPNATIYGIDIQVTDAVKNQERIKWALCNQSKADELTHVVNTWGKPVFDIIIDDGGHVVSQQRVSIETLWKYLAPGGYYVIEDLHTNIPELFSSHPHMTPQQITKYLDEPVSNHQKILECMLRNPGYSFPIDEIEDIYYFSNVTTQSLSCAFLKKLPSV
jgi:hypothetical protein